MKEINEIKLPEGVDRIAVKQHDDRIVIEFIPEKPKFKRGDILISIATPGLTVIFDKTTSTTTFDSIYHNGKGSNHGWCLGLFRHATKEEKQEFFDELEVKGKRWNADKKCIEDIPQPRFKIGDKVRIKDGISSKTHRRVFYSFMEDMDEYIGKKLIIDSMEIIHGRCYYRIRGWNYDEDWLEPYTEELKKGDLAIFWDNDNNESASIRMYDRKYYSGYYDSCGFPWENAIKFESKEQFEKVLRGEI